MTFSNMITKHDTIHDFRFVSIPQILSFVFILGIALATSSAFGPPASMIDTSVKTDTLRPIKSRALTGGRSRASIMRVVGYSTTSGRSFQFDPA